MLSEEIIQFFLKVEDLDLTETEHVSVVGIVLSVEGVTNASVQKEKNLLHLTALNRPSMLQTIVLLLESSGYHVQLGKGTTTVCVVNVGGMKSHYCAIALSKAVAEVNGILDSFVSLSRKNLSFLIDSSFEPSTALNAINLAGYAATISTLNKVYYFRTHAEVCNHRMP